MYTSPSRRPLLLQNPPAYADSNLTAFINILEGCRHSKIEHLVFASSSSVYGTTAVLKKVRYAHGGLCPRRPIVPHVFEKGYSTKVPFAVSDKVDRAISLYAATKKAKQRQLNNFPFFLWDGRPARPTTVIKSVSYLILIPQELMAHSYSHLYNLSITGLRFFTVYRLGGGRIWLISSL